MESVQYDRHGSTISGDQALNITQKMFETI